MAGSGSWQPVEKVTRSVSEGRSCCQTFEKYVPRSRFGLLQNPFSMGIGVRGSLSESTLTSKGTKLVRACCRIGRGWSDELPFTTTGHSILVGSRKTSWLVKIVIARESPEMSRFSGEKSVYPAGYDRPNDAGMLFAVGRHVAYSVQRVRRSRRAGACCEEL